jgi:hypothetical protein
VSDERSHEEDRVLKERAALIFQGGFGDPAEASAAAGGEDEGSDFRRSAAIV